MILNIFLIIFLLIMVVLHSTYGFFSAFLHLCVVIACGTLALAIWEPLTLGFLIGRMPTYAWTVGLLGPFALLLILTRVAIDKLAPRNVIFQNLINKIGGGVCGLGSGLLTAGLLIIGLGFLPFPASMAGVQPYALTNDGSVAATDSGLWVHADRYAADFFSFLSAGSFATSTPLATYNPQLDRQSALVRLRPDPNASIMAVPDSVTLGKVYRSSASDVADQLPAGVTKGLGQQFNPAGKSLVIVDTDWVNKPGTYDADGTFRIPPSQARLAIKAQDAPVRTVSPVAVARVTNFDTNARNFKTLTQPRAAAYGTTGKETLGFIYLIPSNSNPRYLLIRNLRLPMPDELVSGSEQVVQAMGTTAQPEADNDNAQQEAPSSNRVGEREGVVTGQKGVSIEVTSQLPRSISVNNGRPLTYTPDNSGIQAGDATVVSGSGGRRTTAKEISTPSQSRLVRLEVTPDKARSLLGGALAAAAQVRGVYLQTSRGTKPRPIAYVLLRESGTQQIHVDFTQPIDRAVQLPVNDMADNDKLYLYFLVSKGLTVQSYHLGRATTQDINLKVE